MSEIMKKFISIILILGLLFSLYSASRAINALTYSVNKVYHTHRVRSFLKSVLHSALFTLGMSVVLLLALFVALVLSLTIFCVINRYKLGLS